MVNINWDKVDYEVVASVSDEVSDPWVSFPESSIEEAVKSLYDVYATAWEEASAKSQGLRSEIYVSYDFSDAVGEDEDVWDDPDFPTVLAEVMQTNLGLDADDFDPNNISGDANLAYVELFEHYYSFGKSDGSGVLDREDLEEALAKTFGV